MVQEPSVYLPFKTIQNCRDLGGMKTTSGAVIKPSCLIRSADLSQADQVDLLTLHYMGIEEVIDLRTSTEILFDPDRHIPDSSHYHASVYNIPDIELDMGGVFETAYDLTEKPMMLGEKVYEICVTDPASIQAWKKFFEILLGAPKGVLFHCTQGKDRTGIAAALLETALGVNQETILADYLQTNLYTKMQAQHDKNLVEKIFGNQDKMLQEDIEAYMFAHKRWFEATNRAIEKGWGSWMNYLQEAIGLSAQDILTLRFKFLEFPKKK